MRRVQRITGQWEKNPKEVLIVERWCCDPVTPDALGEMGRGAGPRAKASMWKICTASVALLAAHRSRE